jgi:hypothetical protein
VRELPAQRPRRLLVVDALLRVRVRVRVRARVRVRVGVRVRVSPNPNQLALTLTLTLTLSLTCSMKAPTGHALQNSRARMLPRRSRMIAWPSRSRPTGPAWKAASKSARRGGGWSRSKLVMTAATAGSARHASVAVRCSMHEACQSFSWA